MSSPIHRLAPEVLSMIFKLCLERRKQYYTVASLNSAPLVLLCVCKVWRAIALDTSELWDSISLRRRVGPPYGYNFHRDAGILDDWLALAKIRPVSVQLCYGDIKKYGNSLMWSTLLDIAGALLRFGSQCERLYFRLPDDCMEKLLWNICTEGASHTSLRSLTLHSTREGLLRERYNAWWEEDVDDPHFPNYRHDLDISEFSRLEDLGVHFPGPLALLGTSTSVKKLTASIYAWQHLDLYVGACPNLEHLVLELHEPLQNKAWEPLGGEFGPTLPHVHTLEIRCAIGGARGGVALTQLFLRLHTPQLRRLRLRRLYQPEFLNPSIFFLTQLFFNLNAECLEELEIIDLTPEPDDASTIADMFDKAPRLRSFSYRDINANGSVESFLQLLTALSWGFTEFSPAPRLETIILDTAGMRDGKAVAVTMLLQLLATRNMNSNGERLGVGEEDVMDQSNLEQTIETESPSKTNGPVPLRALRLPRGYLDIVRNADKFGICKAINFGYVTELDDLNVDEDLDDGDDSLADLNRRRQRSRSSTSSGHSTTIATNDEGSAYTESGPNSVSSGGMERSYSGNVSQNGTFGLGLRASSTDYYGGSLAEVERLL